MHATMALLDQQHACTKALLDQQEAQENLQAGNQAILLDLMLQCCCMGEWQVDFKSCALRVVTAAAIGCRRREPEDIEEPQEETDLMEERRSKKKHKRRSTKGGAHS